MHTVGVFEAKNRLTALLDEVEGGGEVIITRRGKPIARLAPLETRVQPCKGPCGGGRIARGQQGLHARRPDDEGPDQRRSPVSFVIDNTVALAWCFEDQQTAGILALLDRVVETGAIAPQLWPMEALNGLSTAQRRGRISREVRQRLGGFLQALPIEMTTKWR